MAETTWLQCVMPRPDWEALNKRREKLGVKWSQIIPPAVERYLKDIETGKIRVDIVKAIGTKPAAAPAVNKGAEKKTAAADKKDTKGTTKAAGDAAADKTTPTIKKGADKKKAASKPKAPGKGTKSDPPMSPGEQTPEEDAAELAAIT